MNKLLLMFFVSSLAFAEDCTVERVGEKRTTEQMEITTDVPNHLKGAKIIVRTADGRESEVPAEKFKVVPRKQQFITTHTEKTDVVSCRNDKKNRVSLLGGHGAQEGLKSSSNGVNTEVESNVGIVGGAQYQRMLNKTLSIGVQGQTNKTGSLLLGIDF